MLARTPIAAKYLNRAAAMRAAGHSPRCEWYGQHRYDFLKIEDGMRVEICMDCGGAARWYPVGKTSRHSTSYTGAL